MHHITRMLSNSAARLRAFAQDSGQVVILTAFGLFGFGAVAAMAIDVGLYVVDRRDAQSDVDKAALAGAAELTLRASNAGADTAAAENAAREWAAKNGIDTSDPTLTLTVEVIDTCYSSDDGMPTGVRVALERVPDWIFLNFVGGPDDWTVNTSATACAGLPVEMSGMMPFAISRSGSCFEPSDGNYVPRYGERCDVVMASNTTGLVSELGLSTSGACDSGNSSANVLEQNIVNGATVSCRIGDTVKANSGHNVGKTYDGIRTRLTSAAEGRCDASYTGTNFGASNSALNAVVATPLASPSNGDGMDDFYEIWEWDGTGHPGIKLAPRDCDASTAGVQTSPRNVVLIVIQDYTVEDGIHNKSYIVRDFARAYIEGCTRSNGTFYKDCDWGNGAGGTFTIHVRFVEQYGLSTADLGTDATFGDIEVFLKK